MSAPILSNSGQISSLELSLADIWRRVLGIEQVGLQDDFFRLGGDSLSAAHMVVEIQKAFGRQLPLTVLQQAPTIRDLARLLDHQSSPRPWACVQALQPRGSEPPFFCVHGAGGSVLCFMELARHFAPDRPFYGIRAPAWQGTKPRAERVADMAARYVEAVRDCQRTGPYYLGGYSFGGSVALEMAQQLRAQGETVALLAVLDHTPPPTRYRRFVWTPTLPLALVCNAAKWVMEDVWHAGRGRRLAVLKRKAAAAVKQYQRWLKLSRSASGRNDVTEIFEGRTIPPEFRRLLEAHYQAMREYLPQPYAGRVALFRANVRPLLRLHGWDLGWRRIAAKDLEIRAVPGNHETMLKPPHAGVLARALLDELDKAQGRDHPVPRPAC
jgi:thioesterase domain-containing protein/acyl carrier protein